MDIYNAIRQAVADLNSTATVLLLEATRAENEELEYTCDVIVLNPDWTTNSVFNQAFLLMNTSTYNIDFKTLDEWDNSDNNSVDYGQSSVELINAMELLANSVFMNVSRNENYNLESPLKWSTEPILRANNGTMSGVRVRLTAVYPANTICTYAV